MFQYHGWVAIRMSPTADDDADVPPSAEFVAELRERIAEIGSPYLLDLRWMNGELFLHAAGFPNHRPAGGVLDLFRYVGEAAPGSYGLMHIRDDEDIERGHHNEVRVLRLVRGSVTEHTEPLLSPCIPTLEDEDPLTFEDEDPSLG